MNGLLVNTIGKQITGADQSALADPIKLPRNVLRLEYLTSLSAASADLLAVGIALRK